MLIEKAFAIEAEPTAIWDALWSDLTAGDAARYTVEQSNRPERIAIKVELGGLPVLLTYLISPKDAYAEVSVTLQPLTVRHALYQIVTFGHFGRNYEMMLVQGLANLKTALEGEGDAEPPD
jgi:hypothetical protein